MPVIDLGECENILKRANNISLDTSLIILELEKRDSSDKNMQFEVFNPFTFHKLNLSVCDNTTIDLYVPLILSEEKEEEYKSVINQGYDPFDLNDKFYREICTPYKSENGTDVLLDDREEYIYSSSGNQSNCPEGCDYSSYSLDNKYIKCECDLNNTYVTLNIKHINGENIYQSFLSPLKFSNYKVMICYNLVFNLKIFLKNIGSILSLICFIIYIIIMIFYSFRDISSLKVKISKILFDDSEKNQILENKASPKFNNNKMNFLEKTKKTNEKKFNYPPKRVSKIISKDDNRKNTDDEKLVQNYKNNKNNKIKKRRGSKKFSKRASKTKNTIKNKGLKIREINQNATKIDKTEINSGNSMVNENENKNLDNFELNNLDYDEACEIDKRGFFSTYLSVLMREHLILFTFCTFYDYNLFYIKLERLFLLICTNFAVNGLFFVHETMYRKYVGEEDFTFIQKIPQLLFTLIVSHIIEVILCSLSMTDTNIYEIKSLPKDEKNNKKIVDIIDCMKKKITAFFIVTFFLFLFYWYFISAFCAVYQNTQVIFLRDSGISFLTSLLDPFFIYAITTLLRIISLSSCCKKKLACVYKLSDIIPIF